MAMLGLGCCMPASSGCGEWGYSLVVMFSLFIAVASLVAEHRLGLSCSAAWKIFMAQGSNLCPMHCKVDS